MNTLKFVFVYILFMPSDLTIWNIAALFVSVQPNISNYLWNIDGTAFQTLCVYVPFDPVTFHVIGQVDLGVVFHKHILFIMNTGFLLDKKIGVNQPKRIENAKILIANTPMDTDKIKVTVSLL